VSTIEQLRALQQLVSTLAVERDDEVLLARLRDGQLPPELEGTDIPLEALSASSLQIIEYHAHLLVERLYGRMGVPRGRPIVRAEPLDDDAIVE
jgi:hypothetical protein